MLIILTGVVLGFSARAEMPDFEDFKQNHFQAQYHCNPMSFLMQAGLLGDARVFSFPSSQQLNGRISALIPEILYDGLSVLETHNISLASLALRNLKQREIMFTCEMTSLSENAIAEVNDDSGLVVNLGPTVLLLLARQRQHGLDNQINQVWFSKIIFHEILHFLLSPHPEIPILPHAEPSTTDELERYPSDLVYAAANAAYKITAEQKHSWPEAFKWVRPGDGGEYFSKMFIFTEDQCLSLRHVQIRQKKFLWPEKETVKSDPACRNADYLPEVPFFEEFFK